MNDVVSRRPRSIRSARALVLLVLGACGNMVEAPAPAHRTDAASPGVADAQGASDTAQDSTPVMPSDQAGATDGAAPVPRPDGCPPLVSAGFGQPPSGGDPAHPPPGDPRRISLGVLADRLSRALWGEPAGAEVSNWVGTCGAITAGDVRALAQRMLHDGRSSKGIAAFAESWLDLASVATVAKDDPALTPALRADLAEETRRFVVDSLLAGPATLADLFGRPSSFLTPQLARLYGVPEPAGPGFTAVNVDPKVRAGILTQGSVLALTSDVNRSLPTRRGEWIRTKLLYREMVPQDPVPTRPGPPPATSMRAWVTSETPDHPCRNCHELADPFGFVLDGFDPIGRARPVFNGSVVDTSATVDLPPMPLAVDGPAALATALAASPEALACFARAWLTHATSKKPAADDPSVIYLLTAMANARSDLREVIVSSVMTAAFLAP
jgi:hypothetical protein